MTTSSGRRRTRGWRAVGILVALGGVLARMAVAESVWDLARREAPMHRFSTLFTAHDVRQELAEPAGLARAMDWCRKTGVTKVYLETFRDGYEVDRAVIERARDAFRAEGFEVSGCVTPTNVGKKSNRWTIIACYTDAPTQDRIGVLFEHVAALFDEVMIDDFWFTDCSCAACDTARKARQVTVGDRTTPTAGDTWDDYRRELLLRLSAERVLAPARRVNPKCRLIVKYPQWYDTFHERGYDVDRETRIFDRIWVGTETRDYEDKQWGGTVQYEGYFLMRWLGGIGGEKCGGGWYDWLGTTERTYLEQARQTILGGARESLLFCYGGLQGSTGPKNIEALRAQLPDLLATAREVRKRSLVGVAAYKPANSPARNERRVFDFVGMLGVPLVPVHEFPTNAPAAFFSLHALADGDFAAKLKAYLAAGHRALLTDGLAAALPEGCLQGQATVQTLPVKGEPKNLLNLTRAELDALREPLLQPFGWTFRGPNRVALCVFQDGSSVVQNFSDEEIEVEWIGRPARIPARGWLPAWK